MRVSVSMAVACLSLISVTSAGEVQAAIRQPTNIAAQGLAPALKALARDRDVQLVYRSDLVMDLRTGGAVGELTFDEALTKLLAGTGLTYRYLDSSAITIIPIATNPPLSEGEGPSRPLLEQGNGNKATGSTLRLAQDSSRQISASSGSSDRHSNSNTADDPNSAVELQEVVVTAEKRAERLQDVPVPVTAISGQALIDSNELRIQDYYTSIPGLSFASGVHGEPYIAIRGITADIYSNPSVGITIDDVPYGSSTSHGGGYIAPDIDPSDLARVEVLRGPQGTLYGANSMGGLIKYVTVDPSTDGTSGSVQVGTDRVYNGAEPGYSARGAVNVPLTDTWAIRASAFTRLDPGYIDNVQSADLGVNERHAAGGRLSSLWRPSDTLSLKVSALVQDSKQNGLAEVFQGPNFGDLQQDVLRGTGQYQTKAQNYSAALNADLGPVNLTSLTGYNVQSTSGWYDVTPIYGPYAQALFGVAGASSEDTRKTSKVTQEVRLAGSLGPRFDWLAGGFYTHENSPNSQPYYAVNPATGALVAALAQAPVNTTYAEYAGFTDLTYHFTNSFDVQLGGRESWIKQTLTQSVSGALVPHPSVTQGDSDASAFTYLVTPRFRISPDLMTYARLASGYRPGGPNVNTALFGLPPQYSPDKTKNYELGIKGDALDHVFTFDASVYYIDWQNIQLTLAKNGFAYSANGSEAKSQGVELSLESRPVSGLVMSTWVTWGDAVLKEAFPATSTAYGAAGDRLPNSARFSGNFSLQQDFRITGRLTGYVGGAVSYMGEREGTFQPTAVRQILPAYAQTNLRAGAKFNTWTLNFYLNNLADKRGLVGGGLDSVPTNSFLYIQPRTTGLSLTKVF